MTQQPKAQVKRPWLITRRGGAPTRPAPVPQAAFPDLRRAPGHPARRPSPPLSTDPVSANRTTAEIYAQIERLSETELRELLKMMSVDLELAGLRVMSSSFLASLQRLAPSPKALAAYVETGRRFTSGRKPDEERIRVFQEIKKGLEDGIYKDLDDAYDTLITHRQEVLGRYGKETPKKRRASLKDRRSLFRTAYGNWLKKQSHAP